MRSQGLAGIVLVTAVDVAAAAASWPARQLQLSKKTQVHCERSIQAVQATAVDIAAAVTCRVRPFQLSEQARDHNEQVSHPRECKQQLLLLLLLQLALYSGQKELMKAETK